MNTLSLLAWLYITTPYTYRLLRFGRRTQSFNQKSSACLWLPARRCWLMWIQLWNFIGRQVKFDAFLHPNEHPERICLYLVRQFEAELAKIGHIFTKQSFTRMIKRMILLMKVVLLIWYSNMNFFFRMIYLYLAAKIGFSGFFWCFLVATKLFKSFS